MSPKSVLTDRQQEIYDFVKDKIVVRGYGPTVREIGQNFGIRSPNGVMCHLRALERKGLITRESNMSRAIRLTEGHQQHKTALPMAGQIAAGQPVLAEEMLEKKDFSPLFDDADLFCLKVKGDSMIEDHIADGDYAIVRKSATCRDGEIVAALVDGQEATLKRLYRESGRVRLQPANRTMKPIFAKDVQILGCLVGVIRQFG